MDRNLFPKEITGCPFMGEPLKYFLETIWPIKLKKETPDVIEGS